MRKTEEMVCLVVGRRQIDGEKEKPKSQTACTRITKLLTEREIHHSRSETDNGKQNNG